MGMGWEKLFKNSPTPASELRSLAVRYEPGEEAPSANSGPVITSLGALASGDQSRNGEAKSLKVARTFDSIAGATKVCAPTSTALIFHSAISRRSVLSSTKPWVRLIKR